MTLFKESTTANEGEGSEDEKGISSLGRQRFVCLTAPVPLSFRSQRRTA